MESYCLDAFCHTAVTREELIQLVRFAAAQYDARTMQLGRTFMPDRWCLRIVTSQAQGLHEQLCEALGDVSQYVDFAVSVDLDEAEYSQFSASGIPETLLPLKVHL